jgi:hypothetical protein
MRLGAIIAAALILTGSAAALAQDQEWAEFSSREDGFTSNFPGPPKISQTTYRSQFGADLPARVYSATLGPSRFSLTVVDYHPIEQILTEKSKSCPAGAETCLGGRGANSSTGAGYWKADVAGAVIYATWQFMRRDAKVTQLIWNNIDLVEGHLLHLTNPDKSRTFVSIFMHDMKLYISEGTVPDGYPEPGLFQQSLGWIDENGRGIRYQSIYHQGFPAPPRGR